jgi:hypothetical protein
MTEWLTALIALLDAEDHYADSTGYAGYDFYAEVADVAAMLNGHHYSGVPAAPGWDGYTLSFICDSDGIIQGADLSLGLGFEILYLSKFIEVKSMTADREAVGRESTLAIITALDDARQSIESSAKRLGLSA